jgi:hypothetical protein
VVIQHTTEVRHVLPLISNALDAKQTGHYQHMCFKTTKANLNPLECEASNSDKADIDNEFFLGTLIIEQYPNTDASSNQGGGREMEMKLNKLARFHTLMFRSLHR